MSLEWTKHKYYSLVFDFVGSIFFDIAKGVKHLKRTKTSCKQVVFGFAFGVQLGLWQKQI